MVMQSALMKWLFLQSNRVIRKLRRLICFVISLPFALFVILLFPFHKIRLIALFSDRIGHYAMNTELLLCYLDEMALTKKRNTYLFYTRDAPICNQQLHIMWKRVITILIFPRIAEQVDSLLQVILRKTYKSDIIKKFESGSGNIDIHDYLRNHNTHLSFTDDEIKQGHDLLSALGIPLGSRWICLHVRDSSYLNKYFPSMNWSYHACRDADIQNFEKAALFLANQGYYVIRMGKSVSKSFVAHHPHIIDYAQSNFRSDFADVYLSACCHYFISTSSGLDAIPQVFHKPVIFVNLAPFKHQLQYWYPCTLFIFKKIWDQKHNHFVPLDEVDAAILQTSDVQKTCDRLNWALIENTEDEILAVVQEMESTVDQQFTLDEKNPLHALLKKSHAFSMMPERDLLRSKPEKCYIKIGNQFYIENYSLFQNDCFTDTRQDVH